MIYKLYEMCMNPLEMTKTQELPGSSGPLDHWPRLCPGPTGDPYGPWTHRGPLRPPGPPVGLFIFRPPNYKSWIRLCVL